MRIMIDELSKLVSRFISSRV